MTTERLLRGIAGTFVAATVVLGILHSPYWLAFTAFVGLNLLQSSFSNWCPMVWFLEKMGVQGCVPAATVARGAPGTGRA